MERPPSGRDAENPVNPTSGVSSPGVVRYPRHAAASHSRWTGPLAIGMLPGSEAPPDDGHALASAASSGETPERGKGDLPMKLNGWWMSGLTAGVMVATIVPARAFPGG